MSNLSLSQFNRSYHVTSNSVLSAELWNSVFQNIDQRLIGVEEKKASFEQAEQQLLEVGLRRINETLTPAAEKIMALSEMGFLVASSQELIKPMDGQTLSVHLIKGKQAELFTPSPFVALVRRSTPDAYAIGKLLHYDRDLARVDMNIVAVQGDMGPHDDFDVAALAGSVKAMWDALQESRAIRDDVTIKHGDVVAKQADVTAKHGQVVTKHGDFVSTWYGALTAPPEEAKTGAMYLDIGQNPAVVMVKNNDGWIVAALAADNIYTKQQADAKFLQKSGGMMTGEIQVNATNAMRVVGYSNSPSVIFRKDANFFYFLLTNADAPYGTFNDLRPFHINLTSGKVTMNAGLNVSGGINIVTNNLRVGTSQHHTDGNIYGDIWKNWDSSGWLKSAIDARMDQKIMAALNAFKNNPEFFGILKVTGEIKATGNIKAFTP